MQVSECQEIRCLRCHRVLRSARSRADQLGRGCKARIRAAALAKALRDFSAAQVEKARELISDGGVIRTGHAGVFRTVSSKGDAYYLTAVSGNCNCAAGLRSVRCFHAAAVRILSAGRAS